MDYILNTSVLSNNFSIPNIVVDNHINNVSYNYIKVLLYILRNFNKSISINEISNKFDMSISDINNSIDYWISNSILPLEIKSNSNFKNNNVNIIKSSFATINDSNIKNQELIQFLEHVQYILSRPITNIEKNIFSEIIDNTNLPIDVILMAVEYSLQINKPNIKYIKKICEEWYKKNIITHDKAEKYLSNLIKLNSIELKIKNHFGINDRSLSSKEKSLLDKWINEYNFDFEMIIHAYDKTIDTIGKISFPYINSILESWNKNDIKSLNKLKFYSNKNNKSKKYSKEKYTFNNKINDTSYDLEKFDILFDNVPEL